MKFAMLWAWAQLGALFWGYSVLMWTALPRNLMGWGSGIRAYFVLLLLRGVQGTWRTAWEKIDRPASGSRLTKMTEKGWQGAQCHMGSCPFVLERDILNRIGLLSFRYQPALSSIPSKRSTSEGTGMHSPYSLPACITTGLSCMQVTCTPSSLAGLSTCRVSHRRPETCICA